MITCLRSLLDKLHAAVAAVLTRPEMRDMLASQLMIVAVSGPSHEFTEQVRAETQSWGEFVRENNMRID